MKGERKMRKSTFKRITSLTLVVALCVTGIDVSAATQNADSIKAETVSEGTSVKKDKEGKEKIF